MLKGWVASVLGLGLGFEFGFTFTEARPLPAQLIDAFKDTDLALAKWRCGKLGGLPKPKPSHRSRKCIRRVLTLIQGTKIKLSSSTTGASRPRAWRRTAPKREPAWDEQGMGVGLLGSRCSSRGGGGGGDGRSGR